MRPLLSLLAVLPVLAACATRLPEPPPERIQTTADANKESVSGAMAAPLRDVNVLRTKIPPILLQVMADPYARPKPAQCPDLIALVAPLDAALGEDLDSLPAGENEDLFDRGREAAGGAALGMMASTAQDLIPFRGWVRKLSGAERHDQLVQSAIASGAVRRAYLKGLGEAKGCKPPATPQHRATPAPAVEEKRRPRYPIN
ncbi:MAG: hypothetical protein JWP92_18 [Caulobacter sp.]|nr:hypothetical protein [Caulobacter sp.]